MTDPRATVRLDAWLWAARFYKTRALAAAAIKGGKVEVNGEPAKRARAVRPGDRIRIRIAPYDYRLTVRSLAARRGPAAAAVELYEEDADSRASRERLREQHRLAARLAPRGGAGRPTKKERRGILKVRGKR